ncbi:MAG: PorT family protein [Bacteroidales bacterium]|nr:PorT family protein [Bacteroidales bacterium]
MKKITTTIFAIALSLGVFAQENNGAFSFGARVGMGIGLSEPREFRHFAGQMPFNPPAGAISNITHNSEVNFNIALYGNFAFGNHFSLQPELNFMIYQGYDMRMNFYAFGTGTPPPVNADLTYNSLDIPLLAKINFLGSRNASFGLLVGPHMSIPLGRAEFWREIDGREFEDKFDIDNSVVFGLTAGLFCRIPVGPGRIVADFRFVHDFEGIKAFGIRDRYEVLRRNALVLSLGYEISF